MKRKEQYADEIIEMLERTKCGAWASNINLNTKDRVIEVCQNVVDDWSCRKFKDHCTTLPQALEQEPRWIPIKTRPLTEEEKQKYKDAEFIYDCPLPDDGQEVLITDRLGNVEIDTFCSDDECYFEVNCDTYDVIAWMPLPEPYKAESEVQNADSD